MTYENILTRTEGRVGIVQLNRPKARNALNRELMTELMDALTAYDRDPSVGCLVVAGDERAFAAGADIKEMATATPTSMMTNSFIDLWDRLRAIGKPIIAAVSGFALGGGCELAMACDMIVASETAQFGQPEINLGVIPGAGGTQRMTRAVGKAVAMEMVLNARWLPSGLPRKPSMPCSRCRSEPGWNTNDGYSTCCSARPIRKRAWMLSSTSAGRNGSVVDERLSAVSPARENRGEFTPKG